MSWTGKLARRVILGRLAKSSPQELVRLGNKSVLKVFRKAAASVPAYRKILQENKVDVAAIRCIDDFHRCCPVLNKQNTFARFTVDELCIQGVWDQIAGVLTTSGHGARFAYGLSTRRQMKHAARAIDLGLQYIFGVDENKTLLINCLPMGVHFSSRAVTMAETSVREDMAIALLRELGGFYDQIILVGDPLFMKRLSDYAVEMGLDWGKHKVHVILGEETFGENYRTYLAGCLGMDADNPASGIIGSSMGAGELGLNILYETIETIALRRAAHDSSGFFEALFGLAAGVGPVPMLFVYNPLRTHIEILDADERGYGLLTISMNDPDAPLPLLRYQTGDVARIMSPHEIEAACKNFNVDYPGPLSLPVVAFKGRDKDELHERGHVDVYKDALYKNPDVARHLTGAFRLTMDAEKPIINVQLCRGYDPDDTFYQQLAVCLAPMMKVDQVVLWRYNEFPFGMTLDYERKFSYV